MGICFGMEAELNSSSALLSLRIVVAGVVTSACVYQEVDAGKCRVFGCGA
jgi:hypothetical protein